MRRPALVPSWWSDLPSPDGSGLPVELKVLLTAESRQVVRDAASHTLPGRAVHYFDTPHLDLARLGVVVRLRAVGDDRGDVTVKVRRAVPVRMPRALRGRLSVEFDTLPDDRHWSAALRRDLDPDTPTEVLDGHRSLGDVLGRAQHRLYVALAGNGPALSRLRPVGPVRVRRMSLATLGCGSRVVAETCRYPDGSRLVEVSAKCPASHAASAAEEFTALLRDLQVDAARRQRTKTSTALGMLGRSTP